MEHKNYYNNTKDKDVLEAKDVTGDAKSTIQIKISKLLSNKMMYIMFVAYHIVNMILLLWDEQSLSITDLLSNILGFCFMSILMLAVNPFYLVALILSGKNVKKYKTGYVIACLILSFFMIIVNFFIQALAGIEGQGIGESNIQMAIFICICTIVPLFCILKLFFKVRD